MKEYAITNDGFGIHTFELSIPHLCKDEMDDIMERITNETLNRIHEVNLDYFCNIVEKSKKKLKSDRAFYNMLSNLVYLDMSPISLSYRDKHGDDSVPGLYELLGFES